jgi:sec-independent protein translocase protein TatA
VDLIAFMSPSPMELAVIAIIALIVLGPSRLPDAARSLGKGMREMRDSFQGLTSDEDGDDDEDDDGEDRLPDAPDEGPGDDADFAELNGDSDSEAATAAAPGRS